MVPWTHWREPRLGRLSTDLTSEFTVFNLVIRLRKRKQSALFRVSPCRSTCLNNGPQYLASPFSSEGVADSSGKPPFFKFNRCSRD